jgi:hypothetical protein
MAALRLGTGGSKSSASPEAAADAGRARRIARLRLCAGGACAGRASPRARPLLRSACPAPIVLLRTLRAAAMMGPQLGPINLFGEGSQEAKGEQARMVRSRHALRARRQRQPSPL